MLVSIVTPTFNEVDNVENVVSSISSVMSGLKCDYEHIIIDNCSTDGTVEKLREIAASNKSIKIILNARNFGQIRSPYHATLASSGDVCINLPSDGEVPASIIPKLLDKWNEGFKVVHAVKTQQRYSTLTMAKLVYQYILKKFSKIDVIVNFSGYGLVDSSVVKTFRGLNTVYPFYRGLIGEFLNEYAVVYYQHVDRAKGKSSNNYWSLFEYAVIGLITYTKLPFQISIFSSIFCFATSALSMLFSIIGLIWYGDQPLWGYYVTGLVSFLASVIFMILAMISEYMYQIFLNTRNTPLVVESERLNFGSAKVRQ